ncbi:MAG: pyridoxal phosphate-dependent aminotransferase [Candidatus Kariarchaeaceae archaeon]|jgi:aminotransferase
MEALSVSELRKVCPVKWHELIPDNGISLGVADVDFHGPPGVLEFLREGLREEFSFYQAQQGLRPTLDAIMQYFSGFEYKPELDQIQVIEGTMMGISIAMQWISQKEGKILVLGPLYDPIHRHATLNRNELVWSNIDSDGINEDHIQKTLAEGEFKMIAICNPTNPIGHVYTRKELEFLRDMIVKYDLILFSDELYAPLIFNGKFIPAPSIPGLEKRTISLYGFSKAYGLAGYRSGFMHLGPNSDELRYLASQYMVSPSPIASLVCEYALNHPNSQSWVIALREQCRKTTEFAAEFLNSKGISTGFPSGCFFVFPNIEVDDVDFSAFFLENYGVQTISGSVFGPSGRNHLRINCATSIERLREGLNRLLVALEEFKQIEN